MGLVASIFTFAAAEGEAEPSGTDLILPDMAELIWGAVAFLAVLWVLNKFAFPKLKEAVEAREKQIQSDLEAAERAKAEAERERAEYEKQIADARGEANRIIEEARQSAEQVRKDLIAKAEADAQQIVERAQEQLEAERNRTVTELQSTVGDLAIELAEKVVGRALDGSTHRELVDAYIKEVGTMSGNGRS
ncbi:MAG TPA: F0F1 ATP synthase subunit B [Actinomycetota bacterium]|nr:F0F1 ATP synthase subunit B [Actinomycetota bacterium]